jgi:hypothetical protein
VPIKKEKYLPYSSRTFLEICLTNAAKTKEVKNHRLYPPSRQIKDNLYSIKLWQLKI